MAFVDKIKKWLNPTALFKVNYKDDGDGFMYAQGATNQLATKIGAASACITLLSSVLAGLTWRVYQRDTEDYSTVATQHPINILLDNPHDILDRYSFFEFLFEQLFTHGNSYAGVLRDYRGVPVKFMPFMSTSVGKEAESRRLNLLGAGYRVSMEGERVRTIRNRNMIHFRTAFYNLYKDKSLDPFSTDGAIGVSARIGDNASVALKSSAKHGLRSPGWVSTAMDIREDQTQQYLTRFTKEFTGAVNAGKVPVMPEGMKYNQINATPIDQYIVSVLKWSVEDIARSFGVPLPLIHSVEGKVNSSLERHWASFVRTTVSKHVLRVGGQLGMKILTPQERIEGGFFIGADLTSLHAPTLTDASELVERLARSGVVELDELRKVLSLLNLKPKPDGLECPPQTAGAPNREPVDDEPEEEDADDN